MNTSGLNWTLNLRTYKDKTNLNKDLNDDKKNKEIGEPSFYLQDLEKYKKKKINRSKSAYEINTLPQLGKCAFVFKKNSNTHGTILSQSLLNYELNLRTTKPNNNKSNKQKENDNNNKIKNINKDNQWNNSTIIPKSKYLYSTISYPNIKNLKINGVKEKFVLHPYKPSFTKIDYYDKMTYLQSIVL